MSGPLIVRTEPWEHQKQAYEFAYAKHGAMLALGLGHGKSKVVIDLAVNRGHKRVLIIAPKKVIEEGTWHRQWKTHCPVFYDIYSLVRPGSVDAKAIGLDNYMRLTKSLTAIRVVLVNYESAWRGILGEDLLRANFDLVVADECVPPGTKIATPHGDRPIGAIQVGDVIYGERGGEVIETTVRHTFANESAAPLERIGTTDLTWNHPVWTAEAGYVPASFCLEYTMGYIEQGTLGKPYLRLATNGVGPQVTVGVRTLYNLETDSGNYFANGLLVHNCHRAKAPGGRASMWLTKLGRQTPWRLGLSGTPMAHTPLDLYGQARFIDDTVFGRSFSAFKMRYRAVDNVDNPPICPIHGTPLHYVKQLHYSMWTCSRRVADGTRCTYRPPMHTEYRNLDDLNRRFYSMAFIPQHVPDDVMNLPPELPDVVRTFQLEPRARRIYRDLEREFYAEIDGGEVSVANAMVKQSKLHQLTSGYVILDQSNGEVSDGGVGKESPMLGMRSAGIPAAIPQRGAQTALPEVLPSGDSSGAGDLHHMRESASEVRRSEAGEAERGENKDVPELLSGRSEDEHRSLQDGGMREASQYGGVVHHALHEDSGSRGPRTDRAEEGQGMGDSSYGFLGIHGDEDFSGEQEVHRGSSFSDGENDRSSAEDVRAYPSQERDPERQRGEQSGAMGAAPSAGSSYGRSPQLDAGELRGRDQTTVRRDGRIVQTVSHAKSELLADILEDLPEREPIVVFAVEHRELDAIRAVVEASGRTFGELSGRRDDTAAWKAGTVDVLGAQMRSGSVGIDLTHGHYSIYWNPGTSLEGYLQSRARQRRPGQTTSVVYLHLVAAGTVDEARYAALDAHQDVIEYILNLRRQPEDTRRYYVPGVECPGTYPCSLCGAMDASEEACGPADTVAF